MSTRFLSPLRYPGGKAKFSPFIKSIFELNELCDGHYLEPYVGGAAIALDLLFREYASNIHINDIDPAIYDFWYSVINDTEKFLRLVHDIPVTIDMWQIQRKILMELENPSQLERGFAAFFLNRTNRSGILKAGAIGGIKQSGKWKLDVRFNKKDLIKRIEKIAYFKNRIHIYNLDAQELLSICHTFLPKKSLIYLDPPYYIKGQGLYRNFYQHEDHVAIKNTLKNIKNNWIVSYDNTEEIKKIYQSYRQLEYTLKYSAQTKKAGSEVLLFDNNLQIPSLAF